MENPEYIGAHATEVHDKTANWPYRTGPVKAAEVAHLPWENLGSQERSGVDYARFFDEGTQETFHLLRSPADSGSEEYDILVFNQGEWGAFTSGVKDGEFDFGDAADSAAH